MAQITHKEPNLAGDVLRSKWQLARMDRKLQSMIQVFIRIVFWSIGRQEKDLDFLRMVFQPWRNQLAVVDLQIIQNQEHFPLRGTHQLHHEPDQPLLVHRFLIDHKANMTLAVNCRDHIDPLPFCLHW